MVNLVCLAIGILETNTLMGKFYAYLKIKYSFFSHYFPGPCFMKSIHSNYEIYSL